jgi:hypothetical protein
MLEVIIGIGIVVIVTVGLTLTVSVTVIVGLLAVIIMTDNSNKGPGLRNETGSAPPRRTVAGC